MANRTSLLSGCSVLLGASVLLFGCHSSTSTGRNGGGGSGGGSGFDGSLVGVDGNSTKLPIGQAACSDGMDNDGDGKIDYLDPECVGPLDNDEGTFATGIPGDNIDACKQDCFFDGNSGMGDDGCEWQLKCDPRNTGATSERKCPYDPDYAAQHAAMECSTASSQSDACIAYCQRLTPNGCDCFGCCNIPGAPTPIRLAATCTAAKFGDPTACPPCTQVTACINDCERCEICIGKDTLPTDCFTTPPPPDSGTYVPPPQCPTGVTSCGPGGQVEATACPAGTGCLTGCCVPVVP
jgi:hypothetical protein